MLDKIEILYIAEDKKYSPKDVFNTVATTIDGFAHSIHYATRESFPEALELSEEEYNLKIPEITKFLISDEGKDLINKYEIEALSTIAITAIKAIFQITNGNDKLVRQIFDNRFNDELSKFEKK